MIKSNTEKVIKMLLNISSRRTETEKSNNIDKPNLPPKVKHYL